MFVLWRKFRLDFEEKRILKFGILSGIIFLSLGWNIRMWVGVVGVIVFLALKRNLDFWEIGDVVFPILSLLIFWPTGLLGMMILGTYRKFRWYKSGRPGLSGLVTVGALGIFWVISGFKTGFIDQVMGVWLLTGSLISVYLRR